MARALQAEFNGTAAPAAGGFVQPPQAGVVMGTVVGTVMPPSSGSSQPDLVRLSAGTVPGSSSAAALYAQRGHPAAANGIAVPAGMTVPALFSTETTMNLPLLCGLLVAGGDPAILAKSVHRVLTTVSKSSSVTPAQGQMRKVVNASGMAVAFGTLAKEYYFTLGPDKLQQLEDEHDTSQIKRQWNVPIPKVEEGAAANGTKFGGFPIHIVKVAKAEGGVEDLQLLSWCEGERRAWMVAMRLQGSLGVSQVRSPLLILFVIIIKPLILLLLSLLLLRSSWRRTCWRRRARSPSSPQL
jgi:hypothetical protein